mgnify:FL=1
MKLTELKTNQAIGVETKGVIEIKEGDFVLVGIKCVYSNGQFIPTSRTFKLTPKMFELCEEGEIVPIKRLTQNEQSTARTPDTVQG